MKKVLFLCVATLLLSLSTGCHKTKAAPQTEAQVEENAVPKVYFIKEITPENLMKIYEALGREATGKVAVKVSTGEKGNPNHLQPTLIKDLVQRFNGTIVECNTAYPGARNKTKKHYKTAEAHGFTSIAPVDIMDEEGDTALAIEGGYHLTEDYVGSHFLNYDFTVILSHFKGHPMSGFGGAIKNMAIGIASSGGKAWIHSAGKTKNTVTAWVQLPEQDAFLECMAEAAKAVRDHCGDNILYISVANNLSVDCDCVAHPKPVEMADIGIFASLDPVALDKACADKIYEAEDNHGKEHMIERIEKRHGLHLLEYAEKIGLGRQEYELVELP